MSYREQLIKLFARDKGICQICGDQVFLSSKSGVQQESHEPKMATRDHIIPFSVGGGNHFNNLQLACADCNNLKGASYSKNVTRNMRRRAKKRATKETKEAPLDNEKFKIQLKALEKAYEKYFSKYTHH